MYLLFYQVNSFVGAFHDAVILYALALNQTLEAGYNASNGTEITKHMWNTTFTGKWKMTHSARKSRPQRFCYHAV